MASGFSWEKVLDGTYHRDKQSPAPPPEGNADHSAGPGSNQVSVPPVAPAETSELTATPANPPVAGEVTEPSAALSAPESSVTPPSIPPFLTTQEGSEAADEASGDHETEEFDTTTDQKPKKKLLGWLKRKPNKANEPAEETTSPEDIANESETEVEFTAEAPVAPEIPHVSEVAEQETIVENPAEAETAPESPLTVEGTWSEPVAPPVEPETPILRSEPEAFEQWVNQSEVPGPSEPDPTLWQPVDHAPEPIIPETTQSTPVEEVSWEPESRVHEESEAPDHAPEPVFSGSVVDESVTPVAEEPATPLEQESVATPDSESTRAETEIPPVEESLETLISQVEDAEDLDTKTFDETSDSLDSILAEISDKTNRSSQREETEHVARSHRSFFDESKPVEPELPWDPSQVEGREWQKELESFTPPPADDAVAKAWQERLASRQDSDPNQDLSQPLAPDPAEVTDVTGTEALSSEVEPTPPAETTAEPVSNEVLTQETTPEPLQLTVSTEPFGPPAPELTPESAAPSEPETGQSESPEELTVEAPLLDISLEEAPVEDAVQTATTDEPEQATEESSRPKRKKRKSESVPTPTSEVALEPTRPAPSGEEVATHGPAHEEKPRRSFADAIRAAYQRRGDVGDLLLQQKLVNTDQVQEARTTSQRQQRPLGQVLIDLGHIDEWRLMQALAVQQGVRAWDFENHKPTEDALAKVPPELCRQYRVLPIEIRGDLLELAMADPGNLEAIHAVREATSLRIDPLLAEESRIDRIVKRRAGDRTVAAEPERDRELMQQAISQVAPKTEREPKKSILNEEQTAPVIGLVNNLLADAIRMRASDVHLEPRPRGLEVRYRLDGRLSHIKDIPAEITQMLVTRIKIMADLDIVETRLPQDGRISVEIDRREVDMRVSVLPNVHGQRIVLRILDRATGMVDLRDLGFSEENFEQFCNVMRRPYGLFAVTGPTGSGKTTSLYAALNELRDEATNIMTCEDPVEYDIPGVNQSQVNEKVGLTFAKQLRAILRQDPDVVLVGEIRDQETAQTAVRAAMTGHLVLTTLHANDAPGAIPRLLDMDVDPTLLSSSLIGTMAQRLVRTLCDDCKQEQELTVAQLSALGLWAPALQGAKVYRALGCDRCGGSGYIGRQAIHEVMPINGNLAKAIAAREPVETLREVALADSGFRPMQLDVIDRIRTGETSLSEALRAVDFSATGAVTKLSRAA